MLDKVENINYEEFRAACQMKKGGNVVIEASSKRLNNIKGKKRKKTATGQKQE